jgi:hypothetical protein
VVSWPLTFCLVAFSCNCRSSGELRADRQVVALSVQAPMERFPGVSADDQTICAGAQAYSQEVTAMLRQTLPRECRLCSGRSLTFRLLLENDLWRKKAAVAYRFRADSGAEVADQADVALAGILMTLEYPPLPQQRPRCVLEVSVGP